MNKFAKLFESNTHGQIVVMTGPDESGTPSVFLTFILGATITEWEMLFDDEESRDAAFDIITVDQCELIIDDAREVIATAAAEQMDKTVAEKCNTYYGYDQSKVKH